MQKKLSSALMVASLVLAASLVFIACGEGPVFNFEGKLQMDVDASDKEMLNKIKTGDESIFPNGIPPTPLSSSEELPLSSAVEPPPPPPPLSSNNWVPSSSSFVITFSSSSTAKPTSSATATPSSSSKPPAAGGGCREDNPKKVTCAWGHTGVLTPGTILKPAAFTPPSGCTVKWNYAPDTLGMALNFECKTLDEKVGFPAEGSRLYVLFAELTCADGKHIDACNPKTGLSSKLAPELTGECVWSKNPTTTARGATPSGVSVIDKDKICTKGSSVVYKYSGGTKTWPANGTTGIDAGKYSDVEATLKCDEYPIPVASSCPALTVSAGADYQIVCDKTCGEPDPQGSYQCQLSEATCGGAGKGWKKVQDGECIDVEITWLSKYYNPEVIMICEGSTFPDKGDNSLTIQVGKDGKKHTVSKKESYIRNEVTIISKLPNSTTPTEVLNICISTSPKTVTTTCSLQAK